MNEKEMRVERGKLDLKDAESRMREAVNNLHEGQRKLTSDVEIAKANAEREYSRLKEEVDRAKTSVERERVYLQMFQDELERGFAV